VEHKIIIKRNLIILIETLSPVLIFGSMLLTIYGLTFPENTDSFNKLILQNLLMWIPFYISVITSKNIHNFYQYASIAMFIAILFGGITYLFTSIPIAIYTIIIILLMYHTLYREIDDDTPLWISIPPFPVLILFFIEFFLTLFIPVGKLHLILAIYTLIFIACLLGLKNSYELKMLEAVDKDSASFSIWHLKTANRKFLLMILFGIVLSVFLISLILNTIFPFPMLALPDISSGEFVPNIEPITQETIKSPDFQNLIEHTSIRDGGILSNFFSFLDRILMFILSLLRPNILIALFSIIIIFGLIKALINIIKTKRIPEIETLKDNYSDILIIGKNTDKISKISIFDYSANARIRRFFKKTILHFDKNPRKTHTAKELLDSAAFNDTYKKSTLRTIYEKARYSKTGFNNSDISYIFSKLKQKK
jgi:hypothetical protein